MDRIALSGVRAYGRHGAAPGERDREQPFDVDLVFDIDLHAASFSDALADTVDYAYVHRQLVEIVRSTSYALLERLGAAMLDALFADPRIRRAELTLAKPELLDGATPSVTLVRDNPRWR